MASQLSRAVARKLFSLGAGGSLRTLGSTSGKSCCFSTQGSYGDPPSHDTVPGVDNQVSDSHQGLDATPESFSFDSPAVSELPNVGGEQQDQVQAEFPEGYLPRERSVYESTSASRSFAPRGVYKAILLGEVGQAPVQKVLKSGRAVTIFSVGTGGMHNNRRMFDGESPEEFAERSYMQWHRIAVYQEKVGNLALRSMKQGTQVYLEGNIETRVYNDPNTGTVKRIHEIAIRQNGRLLFMDSPSTSREALLEENPLESMGPMTGQSIPSEKPLEA